MKRENLKSLFILLLLAINLLGVSYSQNTNVEEKGTRTIYLIRHGQYDQTDERDADIGKALVPLGIAQTKLLSSRLISMQVNFTSLTSSTMTRARQTAMIINESFSDLDLKQSKIISECTPPTWRKDIMAETDSTELSDCVENLEDAFVKFFTPSPDDKDRNDLIVCHGNVIRYFVTKVLRVDTMSWLQMTISNCSLTIVKVMPNGRMKLICYNDVGHITQNLQTETGGNSSKKLLLPEDKF
jgi:serine/threonine-protein phosphatase PGAM5